MAYPNDPPAPPTLALKSGESINTGLVAWWPLTDGTGTTAADVSTGGNNGTLGTGVTWGTGSVGANAEFPSTLAGRVDTALDLAGENAITVSAWIRNDGSADGNSFGKIVTQSQGGAFDTYMNKELNISLTLDINSTTVQADNADIPAIGEWFHVCFVWEQSVTQAVYINGSLSGSGTADGSVIGATTHNVFIGGTSAATRPWDGGIQNVRIWNTALTAQQVSDIYTTPWLGSNYEETGNTYFFPAHFGGRL